MEYLCVVEYFFDETPGGSGRVAWDIAKLMRDKGHSVTVLFYKREGQQDGIIEYQGIRLVRFTKKARPRWHPGRMRAILESAADACHTWLKDREWDLVHIHSPLMGIGVMSSLGSSPRYLVTVHSPVVLEQEITWRNQGVAGYLKLVFGRRALASQERKLLMAATAIHTLSDFTCRTIDESYGVARKTTVIPHWYDRQGKTQDKYDARKHLGWPAEATIFLTVRGLKPRNGLDVAIRAMAPLVKHTGKDCYFFIGGGGALREKLQDLIDGLGVANNIRLLGRLTEEDLEAAYAAADMFLLPTTALECYGLITVEALSFGCPVISSDAAAIPEIMRPILPNSIVPAGDTKALHDKMKEYLAGKLDIPDQDVMKAHVFSRYSRAKIAPKYLNLLENE
jgi:glycosyltransferase involved in cell wall biosynthesis